MSLMLDLADIENDVKSLKDKAHKQQIIYSHLITGMVALHQKYRLAKNYEISDELRNLLMSINVKIIQGTAGYEFKDIPASLKNHQFNDTWVIKE